MATKLYLHRTELGAGLGYPTTEQSSLTPDANLFTNEDGSENRAMDKTISAVSQATLTNASTGDTSSHNYYIARWVSPLLAQTSIAANTWTLEFAASESNAAANFPRNGAGALRVCCYVWKPSNSTKYGDILDGNTNTDGEEAGTSQTVINCTFSGASVGSLTAGDAVIVFELWAIVTQGNGTSRTQNVFYDGTTEASTSNMAARLETPENLTFMYQRSVEETLGITDAQSKLVKKSVAETLSLTDTQQKLIKKAVAETLALTDTTQKFIKQTINESLAIVDNSLKKGSKFVTDALDITDDADSLFIPGEGGELFQRSASDTLDLTDSVTKVVRKAVSESLDLTDTQNKLVKKGVTESLALNDDQQKKGNKFVQEALDIIDDAVGQFISGSGTLFQRAVNETLDLADSVASLFIPTPPPSIPGQGIGYRPPKPSVPIKRPALIYRINVFENLDLKDKVNSVARHYNLPIYLITQIGIREQLSLIDEATIRVIRKGRNKILKSITNILESFQELDTTKDNDSVAIAQELSRININRTKTNRLAKLIEEALQKELVKILKSVFKDYKESNTYLSVDTIKMKYEGEVLALVRSAVQESYVLGINYVGKALNEPNIYLSGHDVEIIKRESERIAFSFWRHAGDFIRSYQLNEHMKSSPVGLGGFLSLDSIAKFISGLASMSTINKATTAKMNQLPPPSPTVDPVTNVATVEKRILVFKTKQDFLVCPICQQYEGVEYFEDDPFIVRPVDDTHPNCRCRLLLKTEVGAFTG